MGADTAEVEMLRTPKSAHKDVKLSPSSLLLGREREGVVAICIYGVSEDQNLSLQCVAYRRQLHSLTRAHVSANGAQCLPLTTRQHQETTEAGQDLSFQG